jgi:hypothetical protein
VVAAGVCAKQNGGNVTKVRTTVRGISAKSNLRRRELKTARIGNPPDVGAKFITR